jgi:hypothetical protein
MSKTLYGDGTQEVTVEAGVVSIRDGDVTIEMSEAAFREVHFGWERYVQTKPPAQTVQVEGIASAEEHGHG